MGCLPHTRTQQRINPPWLINDHHISSLFSNKCHLQKCCWSSSLSLKLQSCFLHIQTTARRFAVHQPTRQVWGKMGGALCSNPKTLSSVSWPLNLRWISPCYGCWCPLIVHNPHPWQNQPAACWWWVQTFSKLPTGAPKWMPTKICIDNLVVLTVVCVSKVFLFIHPIDLPLGACRAPVEFGFGRSEREGGAKSQIP